MPGRWKSGQVWKLVFVFVPLIAAGGRHRGQAKLEADGSKVSELKVNWNFNNEVTMAYRIAGF